MIEEAMPQGLQEHAKKLLDEANQAVPTYNFEDYVRNVLEMARETYGNKNQILVCIEELNELACVLAKYPRYDIEDEAVKALYDKALDEVTDVEIILRHVKSIFKIDKEDIHNRTEAKIERLIRWLSASDSMQRTTEDREVSIPDGCKACWYTYNSASPTCASCGGQDPCYHA